MSALSSNTVESFLEFPKTMCWPNWVAVTTLFWGGNNPNFPNRGVIMTLYHVSLPWMTNHVARMRAIQRIGLGWFPFWRNQRIGLSNRAYDQNCLNLLSERHYPADLSLLDSERNRYIRTRIHTHFWDIVW